MNECLSGKGSHWGKSSAGMTYRGSYLQDRSTYMEDLHKILLLKTVYLLFWSILSPSEDTSKAAGHDGHRRTQLATFMSVLHRPAQHLPGSFGAPET